MQKYQKCITAALLAVTVVMAFATPAFAWHPVVTGSTKCVEGKVLITWKITNGESSTMHTVSRLFNGDIAKSSSKTVTETVASGAGPTTLSVKGSWDGHEQNIEGKATVQKLTCEQPPAPTTTTTVKPPVPPVPPTPPVVPPTPPAPPAPPETAVASAISVERVPFTG